MEKVISEVLETARNLVATMNGAISAARFQAEVCEKKERDLLKREAAIEGKETSIAVREGKIERVENAVALAEEAGKIRDEYQKAKSALDDERMDFVNYKAKKMAEIAAAENKNDDRTKELAGEWAAYKKAQEALKKERAELKDRILAELRGKI